MTQNSDFVHGESAAISNHRNSPFTRDLLRRRSANQSDEDSAMTENPAVLFEIDRYLTSCGTDSLENVVRSFPDWVKLNPDSRLISVEQSSDSNRHVNITFVIVGRKRVVSATLYELRRLAAGGRPIMRSSSSPTSASEA